MASHYQPLLGKRHIRLLALEDDAVQQGQPLRCKFEERNIDRILPWDTCNALSYVWGSSPDRVEITCNALPAHITANLCDALTQIWTMTPRKMLWADALYIIQTDDVEKGHQVGMMEDIYRQAGAVITWLGRADQQIFNIWDSVWANNDLQEANTEDVDHFLRNDWFFRVWTLQELLLALKAVALCGTRWIERDFLLKTFRVGDPLEKLRECKRLMQAPNLVSHIPSPFSSMVLTNLNRGVTDPLDRIYALLGIIPHGGLEISPSYEITPTELYRRAFIANFKKNR
jgi:hypothetical protein